MSSEQGFFIQFEDGWYSLPYDKLSDARAEARRIAPEKKLKIYHGVLKRDKEHEIFDDSKLYLVPRIGGYE
jgi:hypothetical protein